MKEGAAATVKVLGEAAIPVRSQAGIATGKGTASCVFKQAGSSRGSN